MTNTINNVPFELLETLIEQHITAHGFTNHTARQAQLILCAPSPAGVDGPVRNFKTREGYDVWDKLCAIPKFGFLIGPSGGVVKVADIGNWIDRDEAQSVVDEAQCEVNLLRHEASAAQAIIDGLRGDLAVALKVPSVAAMHAYLDTECAKDNMRLGAERDQQAQRIGELEGLLREVRLPDDIGRMDIWTRIDAALSAGKEGE